MVINTLQELKESVKRQEPELIIINRKVIKRVLLLMALRKFANILMFVLLGIALFIWANPLRILFFEGGEGRLLRQILLGIGIFLVFAEYLIPVVRMYKVASIEEGRLKLILRSLKG